MLAHLFVTIVSFLLVIRSRFPVIWAQGGPSATLRRLVAMAKRYRRFPKFTVPAGLLNSLAIQSLPLVSAVFFAPAAVGYLGMAQFVGNAPAAFVTQSMGQVVVQHLANNRAHGHSNVPIVVKIVRTLFLISVPFAVVVILFGDSLFAFVFGEKWRPSGDILVMLLPIVVANLCVNSVSLMYVYDRNRAGLVWQAAFMTVTTTSIAVGGMLNNFTLGVWAYSISGAIMYVIHLALTLRFGGGGLRSLISRKI